jgi:hypothetical protein
MSTRIGWCCYVQILLLQWRNCCHSTPSFRRRSNADKFHLARHHHAIAKKSRKRKGKKRKPRFDQSLGRKGWLSPLLFYVQNSVINFRQWLPTEPGPSSPGIALLCAHYLLHTILGEILLLSMVPQESSYPSSVRQPPTHCSVKRKHRINGHTKHLAFYS